MLATSLLILILLLTHSVLLARPLSGSSPLWMACLEQGLSKGTAGSGSWGIFSEE